MITDQSSVASPTKECAEAWSPRDAGFVLVFFALSLVALMGIAALVVDVGAWYLRADKIQRAADAAACSCPDPRRQPFQLPITPP